MPRDDATLFDIATAAERIGEFVTGMDKEAFLVDAKTQSAILHQLMVLGEATRRLSEEFRTEHSDVPEVSSSGCATS